jgi:hypothetical protein
MIFLVYSLFIPPAYFIFFYIDFFYNYYLLLDKFTAIFFCFQLFYFFTTITFLLVLPSLLLLLSLSPSSCITSTTTSLSFSLFLSFFLFIIFFLPLSFLCHNPPFVCQCFFFLILGSLSPSFQIDRPRQLFVVDNDNKRIEVLDADSFGPIRSIALGGDGDWFDHCLYRSDPASEDVLLVVSDCRSHTVKVIDASTGAVLRSIGQGGAGSAPGQLFDPYYLAMHRPAGGAAVLIVSNGGGHRFDLFDFHSGRHLRSIGAGQGAGPGQLFYPCAIAVWTPAIGGDVSEAQVVVADYGNHRLQFFRLSDGRHVRSVGVAGSGVGQLQNPWALSIHMPSGGGDDEALLVTIGDKDSRIHVFSLVSGEYLRCLGGGSGSGVDQVKNARGIAFHRPSGCREEDTQIIISDYNNHRLQVFELYSGRHVRSVGKYGEGAGDFNWPWSVELL